MDHLHQPFAAGQTGDVLRLTKMHGLGNDYLYVYGETPQNIADLSMRLSDRHCGIGADGMIYIAPSEIADFKMRIFNADGSEAKMCGNGIRCVGKYVYDKGYTDKTRLTIETRAGIKTLDLFTAGDKAFAARVQMGKAVVQPPETLQIGEETITFTPVSVGNPHAVVFCEDAQTAPVEQIGRLMEHHARFPDGVNVEFVSMAADNALRMRVWERGSGITMACGTGSCASAAAAVYAGLCSRETDISVRLDGGTLTVRLCGDDSLLMTGPAATVCECEVTIS